MSFFVGYEKTITKIVQSFLVVCLLTPFIVGTRHLFPFVFPKALFFQAGVAMALIFFLSLIWFGSRRNIQPRAVWICFGLWGLSIVLSGVFGFDPANSLWSKAERMDSIWFYAHLFAFVTMLYGVFRTKDQWLFVLKANTIIGVGVGLMAIATKYLPSWQKFGVQTRLSGTFGNPSFLATYFVIFIFLALILVQYAKTRNQKIIWLLCALFGMLLIILSGTRGAYIGTFAGIGVWISGLLLWGSSQYRKIGLALVIAVMVLAGSFLVARPVWERVAPMIASRVYSSLSIPTQRVLVWQLGIEAFKIRPVFGWGQENFVHAFNKYFNPEIFKYEVAIFDRPHNKAIDVLVTTGGLGMVAYGGLFIVIIWYLGRYIIRARRERSDWDSGLGIGIGLVALWVAYHIQNLVLFEMPTSAIQMFFALAFSFWFLSNPKNSEDQPRINESRSAPGFVDMALYGLLVIVIIGSLWVGTWIPFRASRGFIDAMVYLSQPMTFEIFENGRQAYISAREKNTFLNKEFDINISRHLRNVNLPRTPDWSGAYLEFADTVFGYMDKDSKQYRGDYDLLVEMGNLMVDLQAKYQYGNQELFEETSQKAIGYASRRFEAYESLFLSYSIHDKKSEARAVLDKLFELGPEIGDTWYYQALFNAQWGDHDAVISDLENSLRYSFSLHDKQREQEWLLNLYIKNGRIKEALAFLEFLRLEPRAPLQYQLRYRLLQIEIVYISGDLATAKAMLNSLLNESPAEYQSSILRYFQSKGIVLEQ